MATFAWAAGLEIGDARIQPGEPITSDLMMDYRDRDEQLRDLFDDLGQPASTGHNHDGAGYGAAVPSGGLWSTYAAALTQGAGGGNHQFALGHSVFWPSIKHSGANLSDVRVASAYAVPADYVWNCHLQTGANSLFVRFRYVQASRDYPVVYLCREKTTGHVKHAHFHPEGAGYDHPFGDYRKGLPPELEIVAIELKRSSELCEHLYKNHTNENCFLTQIMLGVWTGAIELKGHADPLMPKESAGSQWLWDNGFRDPYDIVKSDAAPALYAPDVKVVDFAFDKLKAAPL